MTSDKKISPADAAAMRWLSVFGILIGNNDQHFGNISLFMAGSQKFTLAPAYDMLPMLYRPLDGALPAVSFSPPPASPRAPAAWPLALDAAILFWDRVSQDERISGGFRKVCYHNYALVKGMRNGPRLVGEVDR